MKTFLSLSLLLLSSLAQAQFTQTVINERTVVLPVDINSTRLKFTSLGYSSSLVKIIVPELAAVTILNHRNIGEDGPCLFTYGTRLIDDVLQDRPEVVDTEFTITLTKQAWVSGEKCHVELSETVTADIRGFFFQHQVVHEMPSRVLEDCK